MGWVILISFSYPHEAYLAKGYLESEGIESLVKDELTAQVINFYSNAIGGVKLLVNESDIDRGIEVMKNGGFIKESDNISIRKIEIVEIKQNADIKKCPFCGSKNCKQNKVVNFWTIALILVFGAFLPILKKTNICFDCGKEWRFVKG